MRLASFVEHEHQRPRDAVENICGVLVHAQPRRLDEVRAALQARPGVEIHAATSDGKLVLTVEDADGQWAGSIITSLSEIVGVISVALVYHHFDSDLEGESVQ